MNSSLFKGLTFLIVPSLEPPRVQHLTQLIELHGGIVVEQCIGNTFVLVNESFVGKHGLNKLELFHSEWDYGDDLWFELLSKENLSCYKLGWVSECLKRNELIESQEFRASLSEEHDTVVEIGSDSSAKDAGSIAQESSDEETDIGSQNLEETYQCTEAASSSAKLEVVSRSTEVPSNSRELGAVLPTHPLERSVEKHNAALIIALEQLSKKYRLKGDTYRARGYHLALQSIEKHGRPITSEQEALSLPNVGPSIAGKIQMILDVGTLPGLHEAKKHEELLDYFMLCHGVGAHTARKWVANGVQTFKEALTVFPTDLNWNVLFGWRYYEEWSLRIPREECAQHLALIEQVLHDVDKSAHIVLTGSYRRGAETCGDIDTVLYKPGCDDINILSRILERTILKLREMGYILCPLNLNHNLGQAFKSTIDEITSTVGLRGDYISGPKEILKKFYFGGRLPVNVIKSSTVLGQAAIKLKPADQFMSQNCNSRKCRRVDVLLSKWSQLGGVMIYFTGNDDFNKSLRIRATKKGWKLTNNGLYQSNIDAQDTLIESFDEKRIMELLNVAWVPPDQRNVEGYI
ncbi:LANO_0G15720g1_1 [Lachancea nothofagi CBS 11611]|uniref:DNA polymerase n=1 Tax=Lachancea nothofagi CBS 11611 TaxID=1266666 RepID=A0A1G4KKB0_9SACH|nr:LANO_0G15720g1_1 [Lachancea nothofagi CBS 11611]